MAAESCSLIGWS